jgi:hypothetical protein
MEEEIDDGDEEEEEDVGSILSSSLFLISLGSFAIFVTGFTSLVFASAASEVIAVRESVRNPIDSVRELQA